MSSLINLKLSLNLAFGEVIMDVKKTQIPELNIFPLLLRLSQLLIPGLLMFYHSFNSIVLCVNEFTASFPSISAKGWEE